MRRLRPILICLAAMFPAWIAAAPAAACVFLPTGCWDDSELCHPTAEQRMAVLRDASAAETRRLLLEERERERKGAVDHAAELAELLVPNIRPIFIERSDCGIEGEYDYANGELTPQSEYRDLVAGTSLAGSDMDEFGRILREDAYAFGPACNAEFRRTYAAWLRRSLSPEHLVPAWRFLAARQRMIGTYGPRYHRLVRFEGGKRVPPVRWEPADFWLRGQIDRAIRFTAWGRSLAAAADAFWAEQGPRLADDKQACPAAFAEWTEFRTRMVARMIAYREGRYRPPPIKR